MAGKILVALSRDDRIEKIIPYLELMVRPGVRVIFLLRYPVEWWPYLRDHWVESESVRKIESVGKLLADRYSWEAQTAVAEKRISPVRNVLRAKEINVEAELYAGKLRSRLEEHAANGGLEGILVPVPRSYWSLGPFERGFTLFSRSRLAGTSPIMFLYPNCAEER